MKSPQTLVLLFLSLTTSPLLTQAQTGQVSAKLKLSPAGSFTATSKQVESDFKKNPSGKPAAFSVKSIKVKIEDLKTGITLRDQHLHKHLQSTKNPIITVSKITFAQGQGQAAITLNGVTQTLPFSYKMTSNGVSYQFKLVPSQYKLEKAKYLGVGVKDEVEIEGSLSF